MRLVTKLAALAHPKSPPAPGPRFVAVRGDGLCMRLNTILDAALLARAASGRYAFTWDEQESPALDQQTTSALDRVFTPAFIAAHRMAEPPEAPALTPVRSDQALADLTRSAGVIRLNQPRDLTRFAPVVTTLLGPQAYARAFAALDFAPQVRRAIALAQALPVPPGAQAIHLRGGDILHGTHAHHANYLHKAPSVLEIDALIASLAAQGHPVWLIGQEPDVQACMARRHPAVTLAPGTDLGEVAQVIFDAVLMSRMAAVWGGNSGVTLLSRRLGGLPFHDLARMPPLCDPESWRGDPLAAPDFADVSPAMKAHAYVKPVTFADPATWTDLHLDLITLARRWRPDSKFLGLVQVCVLTHLDLLDAAEAEARRLLSTPLSPGLPPEMGYAFLTEGKHHFPLDQTAPLAAASLKGQPALQLLAALRLVLTGRDKTELALARLGPGALAPDFRAMIDRFRREAAPSA